MKTRISFVAIPIMLLCLFLGGCNLPGGGSYKDPNITVTASCPSFGNFVFDVRYIPVDLNITEAIPSDGLSGTCTKLGKGHLRCTNEMNPFVRSPADFMVEYDPGTGITKRTHSPYVVPGCPAYQSNVQLASVTCLPDHQVSFVVDAGTSQASWVAACSAMDVHCSSTGAYHYRLQAPIDGHPNLFAFAGNAPTISSLPLRFSFRFPWQTTDDQDDHQVILSEFYHMYLTNCITSIAPQPTQPVTPASTEKSQSSGWSLGSAACVPAGGQAIVNINYPDALKISAFSATDGTVNFSCVDYHTPTHHLVCTGPTTMKPGTLQVNYTSGGVPDTVAFPDWVTTAPRFCATPTPPPTLTPMGCSDYMDPTPCAAAGVCKWDGNTCYKP
jgi:hypothetical protein